jgi:AraC-like DNA-binding protein
VLSVSSRALLDACERLGLDPEALLAEAGLSRDAIRDPDARLPADRTDALWQAAYSRAHDPALALHAAEALGPRAYRVFHYLGANSATIGDAYRRIIAYLALVDRRMHLTLHVEREEGETLHCVRFEIPSLAGSVPRAPAEFTLGALYLQTRAATGLDWQPARVDMEFPQPPGAAEHRRVFRAPVRFHQRHTQLCIDAETWRARIPGADDVLGAMLERHAAALLANVPAADDLRTRVSEATARELREGRAPSLAAVARRLAIGPRTLQRRLEAGGVTFAALTEAVRVESAKRLLADPALSLAEIAWLLGFSEQSAFHRAFKRSTGRTPAEARRAAAGSR